MIFRAEEIVIQNLVSLPETGMGYQIVEARNYGETTQKKFIIYNCQLIVDFDNQFECPSSLQLYIHLKGLLFVPL